MIFDKQKIKTASDVAEEIAKVLGGTSWFVDIIAQALTDYAEQEQVNILMKNEPLVALRIAAAKEGARAEGYAEAIEAAAKVADGRKFYDPEGFLAQAIRALKSTQ